MSRWPEVLDLCPRVFEKRNIEKQVHFVTLLFERIRQGIDGPEAWCQLVFEHFTSFLATIWYRASGQNICSYRTQFSTHVGNIARDMWFIKVLVLVKAIGAVHETLLTWRYLANSYSPCWNGVDLKLLDRNSTAAVCFHWRSAKDWSGSWSSNQ